MHEMHSNVLYIPTPIIYYRLKLLHSFSTSHVITYCIILRHSFSIAYKHVERSLKIFLKHLKFFSIVYDNKVKGRYNMKDNSITTTPNPIVIFSVYRTERSKADNQRLHNTVVDELTKLNVPHKVVTGSYKGTIEKSIVLPIDYMLHAQTYSVKYNQECFLVRYSDNATYNVYPSMGMDYLGQWTEVTREVALSKDGYTFDDNTGLYYTCIDKDKLAKEVG